MNKFQLITNEVKKVINGKDRAVVTTLLALLTGGNILIEDIPGVGKTTMAVAFSKALGLEYGRVEYSSLPTLCRQISRVLRSITRIQENLLSTKALYSVTFFLQTS